ncbi:MAG: hypothetical protein COX07_02175 [Bacteroidetes bacterium CG23_combo_of_CG06-09_8_20_14_all_32_9]|nr:MAG: hypothetical protein COX07_02175 [Bacteroidetes bacterium CG23_combo_of_CG06-09_8_20_14_all_32_9]
MPANTIRHELGHNLGLWHTWSQYDYCDDTPYNQGCWNLNEPSTNPLCSLITNVTNNVMDYDQLCQSLKLWQSY